MCDQQNWDSFHSRNPIRAMWIKKYNYYHKQEMKKNIPVWRTFSVFNSQKLFFTNNFFSSSHKLSTFNLN